VKNFLIRVGVNGVALWVAALVLPGINLAEGDVGWGRKIWTIFFVAVIFGIVNAVIKPIANLLSLPFIVLTLGLFIFVVNAFMLQLTEWVRAGSTCRSASTSSSGTRSSAPSSSRSCRGC
jgi:putative membrane protein